MNVKSDREIFFQVLKAWDSLSKVNYHPRVVEHWLINDMAPAIELIRQALREKEKEHLEKVMDATIRAPKINMRKSQG